MEDTATMKLIKTIAAYICLIFTLSSCSRALTPQDVVLRYYEAVNRLDFEAAKAYVSKDAVTVFDMLIAMTADHQPSGADEAEDIISIVVNSVVVGENERTAMVVIAKTDTNGSIVDKTEISLVNEQGEWKIAL